MHSQPALAFSLLPKTRRPVPRFAAIKATERRKKLASEQRDYWGGIRRLPSHHFPKPRCQLLLRLFEFLERGQAFLMRFVRVPIAQPVRLVAYWWQWAQTGKS